jgi:hypothetical protein
MSANAQDAWTVYAEITLKSFTVKFHALFGLSKYTGHQKGSSKRRYGTVDISDVLPLAKSLGYQYIGHSSLKG